MFETYRFEIGRSLNKAKRIQIGVLQDEPRANRFAGQLADIVAVFPADGPIQLISEDFV